MNELSMVLGLVVDSHGRPVAEGTVAIVEGTVPLPEIALRTDADGRFLLRLPFGRFILEAYGPNEMKGRTVIEVSSPETEAKIEID